MPYEGEFAQFRSIKRLAESERVKNLLGSYQVRSGSSSTNGRKTLNDILAPDVRPSDWQPRLVLAIDGSHVEVPIKSGFPGAEASYVTVASVLVDMVKLRKLDEDRPVEPREFRKTERADSIDCALPGCNVVSEGDDSASQSLRRKVYEVMADVQMVDDGESLLDTYEALLARKPTNNAEPSCPYYANSSDNAPDGGDCKATDKRYVRGTGEYICPCARQRPFFSTDALRFHEDMNPGGPNGAMFAEVMQVLERVWLIHILRVMQAKGWFRLLKGMAIVLDGPLAVFGHPAWLCVSIYDELRRLNEAAKPFLDGEDILIVGVEKTGFFVEHLNMLDMDGDGNEGLYPSQTVALLDDDYIKDNIIFSKGGKPYGEATYFGRKFFYKTRSGAKLVATLPFLSENHRDLSRADADQFPRLNDAMALLDQVVSSRYPNALTPLVSAHAEAAIPLNLGTRVLERLARELMTEEATS